MNKKDFRMAKLIELQDGDLVWLEGNFTNYAFTLGQGGPVFEKEMQGPFFVKRVLFRDGKNGRVDIIDPISGATKSLMSGWLFVPKEEK